MRYGKSKELEQTLVCRHQKYDTGGAHKAQAARTASSYAVSQRDTAAEMEGHLEQLKGAALLQFLEHGPEMAPAPARSLHVRLEGVPAEQHAWRIRKVLLEGEVILQIETARLRITCP